MKYIITEEQFRKLNRSNKSIYNAIVRFMNEYISDGRRKITPKSRNYGNLREDWCMNGKEVISVVYYFDNDKFENGFLSVSKQIVDTLTESLNIRKSYVLNTITEWYEDIMVPKFEQLVGESGLSIDDVAYSNYDTDCVPEPEMPEEISEQEMIDFIVKNTLYDERDVIEKIKDGENLEELYLHIVDIANRKRITGL